MLQSMQGAKKRKATADALAEMRSTPKPKCPKTDTQVVTYGHGTVTCRAKDKKWRIFMKAPYKIDLTRQWGAKGSRAEKFGEALLLIEAKMEEKAKSEE